MIDIRLPAINGKTEREQLEQIRSYLYQMVPQLQMALQGVEKAEVKATSTAPTAKANEAEKAKKNFSEIKSLIIKSADIVTAYYDEIVKLLDQKSVYVAQSDFGTFLEQTNNEIYGDHKKTVQNITSLQKIFDEDGNIRTEIFANGNIQSGIIGEKDGVPIIGVEIGQDTEINGETIFRRFAQFTANALKFFGDNQETPIAEISGSKLKITTAYITGIFALGGFVDTVVAGGVVTRWEGITVGEGND